MPDDVADNSVSTPLPDHLEQPHLRRLMPQGVANGDQKGVALRDPLGLAPNTMVVAPQVMKLLQHCNGDMNLDAIAAATGAPRANLEKLVQSLDEVGLLWGPVSEAMEKDRLAALHSDGVLPLRQGRMLGEDEAQARDRITQWLAETEDPEVEFTVRGALVPRMDPHVMWPVYAAVYHAIAHSSPDRVVLLGNNHYGVTDGAAISRVGVQSPLGPLNADTTFIDALVERLGDNACRDELDHLADHGTEMQAPWITAALGNIPVVGVVVPDPMTPPIDDDDSARCTPEAFAAACREVIESSKGTTVVIATGDLSHVGPRFGEPRPVDEQRQTEVEQHDREFLGTYLSGDLETFHGAIKWHNNATRWSCLGAARCMLDIVQPVEMELLDYRQKIVDEQGSAMLSAAAIAAGGE